MKTAVILTSSIFYLLGLKMSQNIESTQKNQTENPVPVVQEQVEAKQEITLQKDEKTLNVSPQQNATSNTSQPDSDLNSVIRNKSTHLMEKMD
ncbi:MAG: hypothetical protein ACK5JD_04425 [Mangrovibacterium sp.]